MTETTNKITLWVAVVGNKYGVNSYVAISEETLRDEIFEYVKTWWGDEMGDQSLPQDRDQAIEAYFEQVESESCMIDTTTLAGDFADLFRPLPDAKIHGGFLEIGEWDAITDAYPWEGYVDLMLGVDGQVWARVGDVEHMPEQEA